VSFRRFAAAQLIKALPRVKLSNAVGKLAELEEPPLVTEAVRKVYCNAYSVDMDEAEQPGPYSSFDAFFTRQLKSGARQVADSQLVSPADGALSALGPIDEASVLTVKNQPYRVDELLGDAAEAARYRGGQFAVVYLSPRDYHRVHAPVDGELQEVRGIGGDLYPVNELGERYVPRLFVRNNRVVIPIETSAMGRVSLVMVGAAIVGRISVIGVDAPAVPSGKTKLNPAVSLKRGDEVGIFHLGSTVVLLCEPGLSICRSAGKVRYGDDLLSANER
jgi:phosphatidylserine decarboxylase